jgi:O-antigen/teichoic acid export membrane protein
VDKLLALRGGAEAVALWAQLSSVGDVVAGITLAGLGGGLAVLVAQAADAERRRELLRHALLIGLALSAAAALVVLAGAAVLGSGVLSPGIVAAAALVGWIFVVPGLLNNYWVGRERRDAQLALAAVAALVSIAAATWAPRDRILEWLLAAQAVPALALAAVWRRRTGARLDSLQAAALRRFILPSIAIGVLSPASMLAARALVADALSWHDAGVLQALWRVSDWIFGFASGVLGVLYLARMGAAHPRGELPQVVRGAERSVLLPSAALFILLLAFQRPLLALLYDDSFQVSATAAALFFAGGVLRVASWIPLFALYAMSRTRAIAVGELLSLPLFVLLLAAWGDGLTLELAGASWLLSFLAYALFNYWAMRRS